ncbi:MAG: GntR family transcriptional regulator [Roseibium album]|uniref:GntR family transcriptional regulator n=1 Tax=Roseibium album TaxID=311410 RepID=UPI001A240F37|nr:DNA-binding GntR family transcriptional regulator [Labrenzia sp. EL_132]MBG6200726.1 DNA-binding GntR family transcriptional regulator [Labrenzia sp. EL_13]MBG6231830.1 DNA-binding GntR family transcriptional regulator [Labrenzia sp. EL_208]
MAAESFDDQGSSKMGRARQQMRRSAKRSHVIFESLQKEIMLGQLPPGTTILELELANRFECSQSTVREALMFLQTDGLVERLHHRGTFVADSRIEDARELILIRHDIECRGVRRVLSRFGPFLRKELEADLDGMRAAAKNDDEYQLSLHDRNFHLNLYSAADMPTVRPILRRCLIHNHRFKILNSEPNRGLLETAERHVAILDALAAGDETNAVQALSHHITTIVDFGPSILTGDAEKPELGQ